MSTAVGDLFLLGKDRRKDGLFISIEFCIQKLFE